MWKRMKKYRVKLKKKYRNRATEVLNKKFLDGQKFLGDKFKLGGGKTEYDFLLDAIFGG